MPKSGKLYRANLAKLDKTKRYSLDEALAAIDSFDKRKFDETVDVAINLGVDPKQGDQMVRGATVLPHGVGKTIRVVAVVSGEAEKLAREAGADAVGHKDIIEKIEQGWLEFDRLIATPETLRDLTKVAKVLGPRGLMPSKKTGTVTEDIGKAVTEQKKGTVNYKVEKAGILHAVIGRKSFGPQKLKENFLAFFEDVVKQKPTTSKGTYVKKVALSTTMGPSVILDTAKLGVAAPGA